jgi:hypothetical protein
VRAALAADAVVGSALCGDGDWTASQELDLTLLDHDDVRSRRSRPWSWTPRKGLRPAGRQGLPVPKVDARWRQNWRRLSQSAAAWVFALLFHESVAHLKFFPYVPVYLNVEVCSIVESNFKAPVEAGTVE